jgi:hypothetical protein
MRLSTPPPKVIERRFHAAPKPKKAPESKKTHMTSARNSILRYVPLLTGDTSST